MMIRPRHLAAIALALTANACTLALVTPGSTTVLNTGASAPVLDRCEQAAMAIVAAHDYRGTELERSCFGAEDDPRVDAILSASESAVRVLR